MLNSNDSMREKMILKLANIMLKIMESNKKKGESHNGDNND